MNRLRLRAPITVLVALAAGAVACGNLTLSSDTSASGFAAPAPAPTGDDASASGVADGGNMSGLTDSDAAPGSIAPPATVGSPLCNYDYGGSHKCLPDDSAQCAAPDGGVDVDDGGIDVDGGGPACHVVRSGSSYVQQCLAAGAGVDGDQCEKNTDCAESFECVGSPGQCRHYCCQGQASCASVSTTQSPSFCDIQSVAWSQPNAGSNGAATNGASTSWRVPVCMPVSKCTLFTPCAVGGQSCTIVADDGTTSCIVPGSVPLGGSCETDHCQMGLACLGSVGARTCFQLCRVDTPADCPAAMKCASSAQLFTDSSFGLCQ